jgi:hypothetical protein
MRIKARNFVGCFSGRLILALTVSIWLSASAQLLPSFLNANESLEERFKRLEPRPEKMFYPPQTTEEKSFFAAGLSYFWTRYGKKSYPEPKAFLGYSLFADPYHLGLGKISFLLGSDCSHFVHRLFQMLGANFPYTKTRHFLSLAQEEARPYDYSKCRWERLQASFKKIARNAAETRVGDLIVYGKVSGPRGVHGHIGVVIETQPLKMLHASDREHGILISEPSEKNFSKSSILRFDGPLNPLAPAKFEELLTQNYPFDPIDCSGETFGQ